MVSDQRLPPPKRLRGSFTRVLAAAAIGLGCGLAPLGAGCVGEEADSSAALPGTSVPVKEDGSLEEDPPPLTLRDVGRQPVGSAEEAVFRLWFLAQWGNIPAVVATYHPIVRREVGVELLSRGYSIQRPVLLASRPRVAYSTKTGLGTTVGLNVYRRGAQPLRDSFLLRRSGRRWKVLYDTVLEQAFNSYAQFSLNSDPSAKPPREAVREGKEAAARFRAAYLETRDGVNADTDGSLAGASGE